MRELDDLTLERLLRETLRAEAATVSVDIEPSTLVDRWRARRRRGNRRRFVLLGLAAAIVIPATALIGRGLLQPPETSTQPYQAIILKTELWAAIDSPIDVVAIRADGQERRIATIPAGIFGGDHALYDSQVSATGLLALEIGSLSDLDDPYLWVIVDLRHPDDPPRRLQTHEDSLNAGWSRDGRFAAAQRSGGLVVFDPASGRTDWLETNGVSTYGIRWTADGSSLVAVTTNSEREGIFATWGPMMMLEWDVVYGNADQAQTLALDPDDGTSGRNLSSSGSRLQICTDDALGAPCQAISAGTVVSQDAAGGLTTRYQGGLDGRLMDGRISTDGEAAWLLLDTPQSGRSFALARATGMSEPMITAGIPIRNGIREGQLADLAPDDSLAMITYDWTDSAHLIMIPTDGSTTATYHDGILAGFVSSPVADSWSGTAFASIAGGPPPPVGRPATLPSRDELLGDLDPASTIVLETAHEPPPGTPSGTQTVPLGTGEFDQGIQYVAACVGVGRMTVTAELPASHGDPGDPMFMEWVTDCGSGRSESRRYRYALIDGPLKVTVTADAAASWRLVVIDPSD